MDIKSQYIYCRQCNYLIQGIGSGNFTQAIKEHLSECGTIPCPMCDGIGVFQVTAAGHDPSCQGDCKNCPIPIPEIEPCEECGTVGWVYK